MSLVAAALGASALGATAWAAWKVLRPPPFRSGGDQVLQRVADDVYVYRGHFANSGVLVLKSGVLLVDTQVTPHGAQRLREAIARVTPLPVTHVVNTHYHGDHVGGNAVFEGAEIIASEETARLVHERDEERVEYARTFGLEFPSVPAVRPPTRTFDRALTLELDGERVEILKLGRAETPDACVVGCPARRVLFAGDTVSPSEYPWTGVPFLDEGLQPDGEWVRALEAIRALRPVAVISGHGPPLVGEARVQERLSLLASLFTELFDSVREELRRRTPLDLLVARVDARLRHYADRPDMAERVLCQRFAIYKAVNGLLPERRGRGWWQDLRPSVIRRAPKHPAAREVQPLSPDEVRARALEAVRRKERPRAISLLEAHLDRAPEDAAARGLLSDVLLDGAFETKPFVDAMEFFAAASREARRALQQDPEEPLALLTLGCAEVWGAMVLSFPMDSGIARIERALAKGDLSYRQRLKARFFLGKAHQRDFRDAESDAAYRQLLPPPARFLYPLVRPRLRATP